MLKGIYDISDLIASCFTVPNIFIEDYSWVHTIYLRDKEGIDLRSIIVARQDADGEIYLIQVPDYDRRRTLVRVNIKEDDKTSIKKRFQEAWDTEIKWEMNRVQLEYKGLGTLLTILEREINK